MENRERNILEAATRVFLRYGVKRTSMADIAAEADVARQTLYNIYTNKDDILRGSIRMYGEDALVAIQEGLPKLVSTSDKVDLVLREMTIKPYEILHSSPNAQDLIEGYNSAGRDEMEANYLAFQEQLSQIFVPYSKELTKQNLTPQLLAELVRRSASAIKYQAKDKAHLLRLMRGLKGLVASIVR
ncbi:MAG: helix-turn-helix domain-containing protein [Pseudomonadota bacterium]